MARMGKRTIVRGPCGNSSRSEALKGIIYGWFPSAEPASSTQPWVGIYIERISGTKTHWNRVQSLQKPHRKKDNRQGSSGRDIFIENSLAFLNWSRNRFFPIQILIISPLRNGRRDAQITTLTLRSRPIYLIDLEVPVIRSSWIR